MKFTDITGQLTGALMLITLHVAIIANVDTPLGRSLVLAHLGLFLIWQPLWRSDQQLNWQNSILFIILTVAFVYWLDWWLITGWLILLIGITGGRLPKTAKERNTNVIILFFLFIELLIGCASHLFDIRMDRVVIELFNVGLLVLPLLILIVPGKQRPEKEFQQQVDLFSAIMTALLASLLLLGSIINSYSIGNRDYATAIVETFLFIGLLILLISWLLSPRAGFSGLAQLWTQSLLNIGTPFEQWISEIASLKNKSRDPEEFIDQATRKLISLPMIEGAIWHVNDSTGLHGRETKYHVDLSSGDINIRIFTAGPIGATLLLHFNLLIRIINHFHTAKIQERELATQAHMRAIYETGSRMTHDIKNLLQSFQNITTILDNSENKSQETLALLHRQLPVLTQRLESALIKLQSPNQSDIRMISLTDWWSSLEIDRAEYNYHFIDECQKDYLIPEDLFNSFIDNTIENIVNKNQGNEDIQIYLYLQCEEDKPSVTVMDTGESIPQHTAYKLFKEPVHSSTGLGIGLFQLSEYAKECGYKVELQSNKTGNVKFTLAKQLPYGNTLA